MKTHQMFSVHTTPSGNLYSQSIDFLSRMREPRHHAARVVLCHAKRLHAIKFI